MFLGVDESYCLMSVWSEASVTAFSPFDGAKVRPFLSVGKRKGLKVEGKNPMMQYRFPLMTENQRYCADII